MANLKQIRASEQVLSGSIDNISISANAILDSNVSTNANIAYSKLNLSGYFAYDIGITTDGAGTVLSTISNGGACEWY